MRSTAAGTYAPRIHPTAIVEPNVRIGARTDVWDSVHIRGPASIGRDCIIGEKSYIAYDVNIGNFVKINSHVYICTGVTIADRVMLSAGVIFTNDRYPRAFDDRGGLADSGPTAETLTTRVEEGATLGAGAVVGPGLIIGAFSMIGMGAVLTANVPPHALAYGNPARVRGYVCVCGLPLVDLTCESQMSGVCSRCARRYRVLGVGPAYRLDFGSAEGNN